jgi:hypothetical protein
MRPEEKLQLWMLPVRLRSFLLLVNSFRRLRVLRYLPPPLFRLLLLPTLCIRCHTLPSRLIDERPLLLEASRPPFALASSHAMVAMATATCRPRDFPPLIYSIQPLLLVRLRGAIMGGGGGVGKRCCY